MAVRRSLGTLTVRGRSFVAAGLVSVACAFVLGEHDLLRIGALILALPVLSAVAVSRIRFRLSCGRRVSPRRVPVGHDARVLLRLENVSLLPTGLLLVEDRVPPALSGPPRFVVERIEPHGLREMSYTVRSELRGRFQVGPLAVRIADPFGLLELDRAFVSTEQLVSTPQLVALPPTRLLGDRSGDGESHTASATAAGEDDVAPREYRHGDDLRRVHWRSTARHGELMVRREEQQWRSRGTLFLDTRRVAHQGTGPAATFEIAVSVAASVGVRLAADGLGVRFVTDEGALGADDVAFEDTLLDALAIVRPSRQRTLSTGAAALRGGTGQGGATDRGALVVAVLAGLTEDDARILLRSAPGTGIAVSVLPGERRQTGARLLAGAGWRMLDVTDPGGLPEAWATLGTGTAAPGGVR